MPDPTECGICGHEDWDVYPGLVRWTSGQVERMPRCIDRAACRMRVEAIDLVWQVDDPPLEQPEPKRQAAPVQPHVQDYKAWAAKQPAGALDRTIPRTGDATAAPDARATPVPADDDDVTTWF